MKSEKEKMIAGEPYSAADNELRAEFRKAKKLLKKFNDRGFTKIGGNYRLLKKLLPNAPSDLLVQPPFYCDYGYNIYCGNNVYFNTHCVVLDCASVTIGSNTLFAPNVQIYTATHPLDHRLRREGVEMAEPVAIGDDCWIGGGAVICPGVTIGNRCVVAAGAVVAADVPDDSLVAGIPARVIKKLD